MSACVLTYIAWYGLGSLALFGAIATTILIERRRQQGSEGDES